MCRSLASLSTPSWRRRSTAWQNLQLFKRTRIYCYDLTPWSQWPRRWPLLYFRSLKSAFKSRFESGSADVQEQVVCTHWWEGFSKWGKAMWWALSRSKVFWRSQWSATRNHYGAFQDWGMCELTGSACVYPILAISQCCGRTLPVGMNESKQQVSKD